MKLIACGAFLILICIVNLSFASCPQPPCTYTYKPGSPGKTLDQCNAEGGQRYCCNVVSVGLLGLLKLDLTCLLSTLGDTCRKN